MRKGKIGRTKRGYKVYCRVCNYEKLVQAEESELSSELEKTSVCANCQTTDGNLFVFKGETTEPEEEPEETVSKSARKQQEFLEASEEKPEWLKD